MEHSKLPWTMRQNSENGVMQCHFLVEAKDKMLYVARVQSDTQNLSEAKANANLIVTAVNVMPEVKEVLGWLIRYQIESDIQRCRNCGAVKKHNPGCGVGIAEDILKELEGVE